MTLNKNEKIGIFIAVAIAILIFIFFNNSLIPVGSNSSKDLNVLGSSENNSEFSAEDKIKGSGDVATKGSLVSVHYIGTLSDGSVFDSSRERGQAFKFLLGGGQVIRGFDQGVEGMKVGGIRNITIPPELGYGSLQAGSIPPNSILHFEVELVGVEGQPN